MASVKKYWIWGIFISILTIFAMSHNANAVELSLNLDNYQIVRALGSSKLDCSISNGLNTVVSGSTYCMGTISNNNPMSISQIESENSYNVKAGDILTFYLIIQTQTSNLEYKPALNTFSSSAHGWQILSFSEITREEFNNRQYSYNGYINWSPNNDLSLDFYNSNGYSRIYEFVMRATTDGTYHYGLYSGQPLFIFNKLDSFNQIWFSLRNFIHYTYVGSSENKEVEEKTQEAVDESQSAGSSSSSSASQGGANLLTAITGFFNVITNAQPTNCRFNAPLNTYFGNQRLNVDLCSLDLPSGIGALTSIIAIGILIPFAIHMFNKFIALFRSFQS